MHRGAEADGDQRRGARDEAIEDDGNSKRGGPDNDADQARYLEAADFRRNFNGVGAVGTIDGEGFFNYLDLVAKAFIVDTRPTTGYTLRQHVQKGSGDRTGSRRISDAH